MEDKTSNSPEVVIYVNDDNKKSFCQRFIKTLPPPVLIFTIIVFLCSLLYNFLLVRIEELFKGGYDIGLYLDKIMMSYIAGFVFYFISVHIPHILRREKLETQVQISITKIITYSDQFILENLTSKYDFKFANKYPTEEEWEENIKKGIGDIKVDWANDSLNLINLVQREIDQISMVNGIFPDIYDLILPIANSGLMGSSKGINDILMEEGKGARYTFYPNIIKDFLFRVKPINEYYETDIVPKLFPNGKPRIVKLDID